MSLDEQSADNKPEQPDETWPAVPKTKSEDATRPARPRRMAERLRDRLTGKDTTVETTETQQVSGVDGSDDEADKREARLIPIINRQTGTVGDDDPDDKMPTQPIVSAKLLVKQTNKAVQQPANDAPPWTLQQFFNGEIDLDVELAKRFPNMPMMSRIKFRTLGVKSGRKVATLEAQDGSSSVIFDADPASKMIQISFTFGSMITLRFALSELSDTDRKRWLELMRRQQGGLAFLWGPRRWTSDYLICITRKYHSNLYAFSPNNFESAVRMTADVTTKLLDWLDEFWQDDAPPNEEPPQLLTW